MPLTPFFWSNGIIVPFIMSNRIIVVTASECAALVWHTYLNELGMLVPINRIFPVNDNEYLSDRNWCVRPSCDSHMDHNDVANLISGCAKNVYLVIQMFNAIHSFLAVWTPS